MKQIYQYLVVAAMIALFFVVAVKVQAEQTDETIEPYVSVFQSEVVDFKTAVKQLPSKKLDDLSFYIIKSEYGSFEVQSYEFNNTNNCIYMIPNNVILCGNFLIAPK